MLVCVKGRFICRSMGQIQAATRRALATITSISSNINGIQVLTPKIPLEDHID